MSDLSTLHVTQSRMLIESLLPTPGAVLMFGKPKSGKTLLAIQAAIAVASNHPLTDYYRVLEPGPTMLIEQDDPAGDASVKEIQRRSSVPVTGIPFYFSRRVPVTFGPEFIELVETQIRKLGLKLLILDSYTAMRGPRGGGVDIVKTEQRDLTQIDELAKRTSSTIIVIHHASKGAAGMDWSDQAAGTFAMGMAVEAQISVSRFTELEAKAPERLVRVRGRHIDDVELVLRFRKDTLDYEHVLEGGAAPLFPLVQQLQNVFGSQPISPKDLSIQTGVSKATAGRQIERLYHAGVLTKRGFGEYVLAVVKARSQEAG